uniref:AAA+ ATPase domain-containing protein n=1 Tax=Chromera velia CCMP2878 TaxID=1169474 RepID=A0A0G4IFQ9_9ALVE|eukprot:Cvel_2467.t1-p1 / transcript=Cvel_2467.t1 / gene=Cvel_2467 / organism=Chromera_velia_CCMP2878 / gene_product=Dynein-1-alpha heavy chain, flagellar inner arm I1, putative / transcript_product=Dynein-1-alpha heavy chain, flagellar inner arm I1, putative / location=Cvel_scaffold97:14434-54247(+) / protein_length=4814 / sequence_SO=supercontig / SO=protein_coding / is_pseudo=false
MATDQRKTWIKNRVAQLLQANASPEKWDDLMTRDDRAADGLLMHWLNDGRKGQTLFFYSSQISEFKEIHVTDNSNAARALMKIRNRNTVTGKALTQQAEAVADSAAAEGGNGEREGEEGKPAEGSGVEPQPQDGDGQPNEGDGEAAGEEGAEGAPAETAEAAVAADGEEEEDEEEEGDGEEGDGQHGDDHNGHDHAGGDRKGEKERVVVTRTVLQMGLDNIAQCQSTRGQGSTFRDCIYFVKLMDGEIKIVGRPVSDIMSTVTSAGSLSHRFLLDLRGVLREFFHPLLSRASESSRAGESTRADSQASIESGSQAGGTDEKEEGQEGSEGGGRRGSRGSAGGSDSGGAAGEGARTDEEAEQDMKEGEDKPAGEEGEAEGEEGAEKEKPAGEGDAAEGAEGDGAAEDAEESPDSEAKAAKEKEAEREKRRRKRTSMKDKKKMYKVRDSRPTDKAGGIDLHPSLRQELSAAVSRFSGNLAQTIQQVYSQVNIRIPDCTQKSEAGEADEGFRLNLEKAVSEWTNITTEVILKEGHRKHENKYPMAEIEYWRDRNAAVTTLYEQLSLPAAHQVLETLARISELPPPIIHAFSDAYTELQRIYLQAHDTLKFLATLERHFKTLQTGNLVRMRETLPILMNNIKMIWIISRHYNTDAQMEPLMKRIAEQICDHVENQIQIDKLFNEEPRAVKEDVANARALLDSWGSTYQAVRQELEESATDKWEFSRKELFTRSEHMSSVCTKLMEITDVREHFDKFLGPDLLAVTRDAAGIQELRDRVKELGHIFEGMRETLFNSGAQAKWEAAYSAFDSRVVMIEEQCVHFLDTRFQKLRSAVGAFELLKNFDNISTREKIEKKMKEKFVDILKQFAKEVKRMEALFHEGKEEPPITKAKPPIAGAIMWARSVLQRVKAPILAFASKSNLMSLPEGEEVKSMYVKLGWEIVEYEKKLADRWREESCDVVLDGLKQSVLIEKSRGQYSVNFSNDLWLHSREAKYIEQMGGHEIPHTVLNVALQMDKYREYCQGLGQMLKSYKAVTEDLSPVEKQLLSKQLETLEKCLQPGISPLNWNSLGIQDFIDSCNKGIATFKEVRDQVEKNADLIEHVVRRIEESVIVRDFEWADGSAQSQLMDTHEFYEFFERHRAVHTDELKKAYEGLTNFLMKIEENTAGTKTGAAPSMFEYYRYWERRIFNALTTMLVRGLAMFQSLFKAVPPPAGALKRPPLMLVKADFQPPESVQIQGGGIGNISKTLKKLLDNLLNSANQFVRWMDGTCKVVPPKPGEEEDFMHQFTFYRDLSQNLSIVEMKSVASQAILKAVANITKYFQRYKQYDRSYGLWDNKKKAELERLADKKYPAVYFDAAFRSYSKLAEDVDGLPTQKDLIFIRVDVSSVNAHIRETAMTWVAKYGEVLKTMAVRDLTKVRSQIDGYWAALEKSPADLEQLKDLLGQITTIKGMSMDMEITIADIQERFHTLALYKCEAEVSQQEDCASLPDDWKRLKDAALTKDRRLIKVKEEFATVTQGQVGTFKEDCKKIYKEFVDEGPGAAGVSLEEGVELMARFTTELSNFQAKREALVKAETLFLLPLTNYPELIAMERDLRTLKVVYDLFGEFSNDISEWNNISWAKLDTPALSRSTDEFSKKARRIQKENRAAADSAPFLKLEEQIQAFKNSVPLIEMLKHDAVRPQHWKKLIALAGGDFEVDLKKLTVSQVFDLQLHRYPDQVQEIVQEAQEELKLETNIQKIETTWRSQHFDVVKYKTEDKGFVLKANDELKVLLDDHILQLQNMTASRFAQPLMPKIKQWEKSLATIGEVMDVWMQVQRKWIYLESIFMDSDDIRLQLPEQAKKFDKTNKQFKQMMVATNQNPNTLQNCCAEGRLEELKQLGADLDQCQKSLTDYLDTKRGAFPRFFFISDEELLSILGSSNPAAVQQHMLKLYDNCKELIFGRGGKTVLGMISDEGEQFDFFTPQKAEGAVEAWMLRVDQEMKDTLLRIMKEGVWHYAHKDRLKWTLSELGMVVLASTQIWWTWNVEDTFRKVMEGDKHAMKDEAAKETQQVTDLVDLVRQDISSQQRKKVNTLIILDVHARDIVDRFVRDSILDAREFEWESQLRFYWDRKLDDILIRQCTGHFRYCYEYQGLNGRLVITPLTDRCVMTLTTALTFYLGGAPAGPAGTGKTETVKDLAKSLAIRCVVMNCGEGLDYKAMGTIFAGLTQTGFWGCFDEFNRINAEVLSVVSAQIKTIQLGLQGKKEFIELIGKELRLIPTIGIFVTMNPGYAGRSELPDNLKALFRPVTMIVPDLMMICEIMLMSEGFTIARILAKKMTVLYALAKAQLSKQYHYDFALRALKSVLVMAGSLKRGAVGLSEEIVLMRALRDMNMPKFVKQDVGLFQGLLSDLFPGLECARVGYPQLKTAIEEDMTEKGMKSKYTEIFDLQVDKVMQLYETMLTRHTTMVVGPTGGGKSVIIETLANAQKLAFNEPTKLYVINPKAITVNELYGVLDPSTRDWTDGLLSKIFRMINQPLPPGKKEKRYIVYDGDVDAVWVENMNTVMDDNKLLTLTNGERIRLQRHASMLFEVFDLQYASPATISRAGMVYVDNRNLGYGPFYDRWMRSKDEALQEVLDIMYEKYIPSCVSFVLEGRDGDEVGVPLVLSVPQSDLNLVQQLSVLFDAITMGDKKSQLTGAAPSGQAASFSTDHAEAVFIFCLIWSVGAALVDEERRKFDEFLRKTANRSLSKGLLYDFYYDLKLGKWISWEECVPEYKPPPDIQFTKILVPTVDTVRYSWLLESFMGQNRPTLFVGESGTAKTVTVQSWLDSLDAESNCQLVINFSSRTSSMDFQKTIEDNIDKRTGRIFGPPSGKTMRIFIDDLSMPKVDIYGTQQPLALLKFVVERMHMYERGGELDKIILKDCEFLAAMNPPGAGRNSIDPRVVSLFASMNVSFPSQLSVDRIYESILRHKFQDFEEIVKTVSGKLPSATMLLYNAVKDGLPRTPTKFHYVFNLRDLSRVYQGLWQADPQVVNSGDALVRLWRHECLRVFEDRLISMEDKEFVGAKKLTAIIKEEFSKFAEAALQEPLLWGDFTEALDSLMNSDNPATDVRLYKDLGGFPEVKKIFEELLEQYNLERLPMSLVFFEDALTHLTRIHRIIRLPSGNALLVGIGGSGKRSLTKLATYTAGYQLYEIQLSRGYGDSEFREDLRTLYQSCVATPRTFIFTDAHVVQEAFLEYINNLLTVGTVPALFAEDEKEGLIGQVRKAAMDQGVREDALWNFTVNRVRENLHIVLAMSPAGDSLRVRCRNFPGLVSCTAIDWFFPWPKDALLAVAEYFLREEELPEECRGSIVEHCVEVHTSVTDLYSPEFEHTKRRKNYATPKNYLDFLANYTGKLREKRKIIDAMSSRLDGGLTKLIQASEAVAVMSKDLAEKKIIVDKNAKEVQALIETIQEKTEAANAREKEAKLAKEQIEKDNVIIEAEKADADEALKAALPALEAAAKALENLNKNDITEIKSMAKPPAAVMSVMQCVLILRPTGRESGEDWAAAKTMLADAQFIKYLQDYKKDDITDKQSKRIMQVMEKDKDSFANGGEGMRSVSKAGYGLLQWVNAMVRYHDVAKGVEPKKRKVKELTMKKETAERNLKQINSELEKLKLQLETLAAEESEKSAQLKELEEAAATMERRLTAASKLIDGLGSEKTRWTEDLRRMADDKKLLVGDCLLGASFLSYTGPFSFDFRHRMVYEHWLRDARDRQVPLSEQFRVDELLTNDVEIAAWAGQGLPSDELSVQNGILTTRSSRWPLCIDPQMQAVSWIKKKEEKAGLVVKTFHDDYVKRLELAIMYGKPFLFEGIDEELDPMVDPVLDKQVSIVNGQKMITLGDAQIEWKEEFQLYLTSKLSNPAYSPEVMGKVSIINCCVTLDGLQQQLLNVTVGKEKPELEEQRQQLIQTMSSNRQTLKQLEDVLLRELANSKGSILDNDDLISTLGETKTKAVEIEQALQEGKLTAEEIEKMRSVYQKVAKRGSILYFSMVGLANLSSMYEYSLSAYLGVFDRALSTAKQDRIVENRLKNCTEKLTQSVYEYVCMSIFEKHKLTFSFQMTSMIMEGESEMDAAEFAFFIKGNTSLDQVERKPENLSWYPEGGWKDLQLLVRLPAFKDLKQEIMAQPQIWKEWYDLEMPEEAEIPCGYSGKLTPFQKLMLVRVFRTDRVYNAVKLFIVKRLSEFYVQPPPLQYQKIFEQSSPESPVVFVLSPGADPQSDVQKLGDSKGFSGNKFKFLALGQGMGAAAAAFIEQGSQRGYWVMLQNCHLLTSWLKTLEKILEGLQKPHTDFRLWLTTLPTPEFPLGILQRSLKVVTEPPDGLKLNMLGSYTKLTEDDLDECPHWGFKSLVFVVSFFHAVVQERRKYGKIGWNVAYDFNESDFRISVQLLSMYLGKAFENGDPVPWESLKYLIGEAMYGGRVTDAYDRRVLVTYLDEYMGDFIFDTHQQFFFSQAGFDYIIPQVEAIDKYRESIAELPLTSSPEVFGLHPNAEIGYFTEAAKQLWLGVLNMQTSEGGGSGGINRDEYILQVASDVLSKIPTEEMKTQSEEGHVPRPTEVVLVQEVARFQILINRMTSSLLDLKRALAGEIGMSAELDELGSSLLNGFLPPAWARLAPATMKPLGSWMAHFQKRQAQYEGWASHGEPPVFWLSGLHIPDSLLTALIQTTCRKKGWALDKSTFYTECTAWTDPREVKESLEHGTYIEGLYIEGAQWSIETGCLVRQRPKVLVQELPLVQVIPIEYSRLKLRDSLRTPVYVTQARRNAMGVGWVMDVNLHTKEHPSLWILQGVACCLNTDI